MDNSRAVGLAPAGSAGEFQNFYKSAQEYLTKEQFEDASQAFANALNLDPLHTGALYGQALSLRKLDREEEAQHVLNRALFLHPSNTQLLIEQGDLYIATENYEKAVQTFERVPLGVPESEAALEGKAASLRSLSRYEEAAKVIADALASFPLSKTLLTVQAFLYVDQERFDEAIEAFLKGNDEDALVLSLQRLGIETARQEKLIEAATRRLPKSVPILNIRGDFFAEQERYDKALESFESALAAEPDNTEATLGKIRALRKQARFKEAAQAIAEAIAKYPDDAAIREEKAWLYDDQQQYDAAVEISLDNGDERGLIEFLKKHRIGKTGTSDAVAALLEAAVRRLPKNAGILNRLGRCYRIQKKYSQAAEAYDRAAKADAVSKEELEEALAQKIESLRLLGAADATQIAITVALQRLPGNKALIAERAWFHYQQKKHDLAVADFVESREEEALRAEIESLLEKKQFDDCAQLIQAALGKLEHDVQIINNQGWLYYENQKQYEQALAAFERALKIDANDEGALEGKCAMLRLQGRFAEAELALQEALGRKPDSKLLLIQRGLMHYSRGQWNNALETFETILKVDPRDPYAIQWKILSLRAGNKLTEAERVADQALKDEASARVLYERGRLFYEHDEFQKADEFYLKAVAADPEFMDSYFARLDTLKRLNRSNEALALLQRLEQERPEDLDVRVQLGWFLLRQGDLLRARQEFESMLALGAANSTDFTNSMASLAFFEERYGDAEQEFRKALKLDPQNETFHGNLAWALVRQATELTDRVKARPTWLESLKQATGITDLTAKKANAGLLREAEEHCRIALQLAPTSTDPYGCLGVIAFKRGRFIESEDFFKQSIELNPKEGNYVDLGALYAQMGRYEEAREKLEKARQLDRTDMRARLELGNVYLQTDQLRNAINMFREAMAVNPNSPEPPRALALALMRAQEFTEAGRVLRKAIRSLDQSKRWQLHLTLCQLLTDLGDKNDDAELYDEALKEASTAIVLKPDQPSPYFYAGIVRYKLEDYTRALKQFRECLKTDPDHFDAEQNARRIESLLRRDRVRTQSGRYIGIVLGVMCAGLLATLWILYFRTGKITGAMLSTLSPILLGLIFVAFLMPWLSKLKLPGVEAELSRPKEKVSAGPTGSVSFGSSSLSTGPQ